MKPKIKILKATFTDIPEILKIEKQCFKKSAWSENALKESFESKFSYFICAKIEEKTIGYAGMYNVVSEGYVFNIAVCESFRKLGVGTSLVRNLIEFSKNKNLDFLSLEVRESNKNAINFYEKMGFKFVGIRKNFYDLPKENGIIMTFYLNKN